jgi:predicted transcriptional regulator
MQVEKEHMRAIKDGSIVKDDRLEGFLTVAESLDRQMLQVMRHAIAEVLAREEVSHLQAA